MLFLCRLGFLQKLIATADDRVVDVFGEFLAQFGSKVANHHTRSEHAAASDKIATVADLTAHHYDMLRLGH